jgi:hypothetical protein
VPEEIIPLSAFPLGLQDRDGFVRELNAAYNGLLATTVRTVSLTEVAVVYTGELADILAVAALHPQPPSAENDPLSLRIGDHFSPPRRLLAPPADVVWDVLTPNLHKRIGLRDGGGYVTRWDFMPIVNGVRGDNVVCEHHTYLIPSPGAAPLKRDVEIEWLRRDGIGHPDRKFMEKWYDTPETIAKEGKLRRGKLMEEAQGLIYQWLLSNGYTFDDGKDFVTSLSGHVSTYEEYSDMGILATVQASDAQTFPWLDQAGAFSESLATPVRDGQPLSANLVTPREFLIGILDIYATSP